MLKARLILSLVSFSIGLPAAADVLTTQTPNQISTAAQACLDLGQLMEHGGSGAAINRLAETCATDRKARQAAIKYLTTAGFLVPGALTKPVTRQIAQYVANAR